MSEVVSSVSWLLAFTVMDLFLSGSRPSCVPPTVTHDHRDGAVEFSWKRHRLFNHTACLVLYQLCMEVRRALQVMISENHPVISQAAPSLPHFPPDCSFQSASRTSLSGCQ